MNFLPSTNIETVEKYEVYALRDGGKELVHTTFDKFDAMCEWDNCAGNATIKTVNVCKIVAAKKYGYVS